MIKAIIFDMDGVLIDSPKYVWKTFNLLLKDEGVHFSDKNIKKYSGRSLKDQLKLWKKDYGIKDYNLKEFSKKAGEMQIKLMKKEFKEDVSLLNLIKNAKQQKIKLAVATSSMKWRAKKILNLLKLRKYFKVLVTAEDIKNHKPHPDIFLEASKRLKIKPKYCVVIEDAVNGITAAKRAKMKAIGKLTKFQSKQDLNKADLIIKNFSELSLQKINDLE